MAPFTWTRIYTKTDLVTSRDQEKYRVVDGYGRDQRVPAAVHLLADTTAFK